MFHSKVDELLGPPSASEFLKQEDKVISHWVKQIVSSLFFGRSREIKFLRVGSSCTFNQALVKCLP